MNERSDEVYADADVNASAAETVLMLLNTCNAVAVKSVRKGVQGNACDSMHYILLECVMVALMDMQMRVNVNELADLVQRRRMAPVMCAQMQSVQQHVLRLMLGCYCVTSLVSAIYTHAEFYCSAECE